MASCAAVGMGAPHALGRASEPKRAGQTASGLDLTGSSGRRDTRSLLGGGARQAEEPAGGWVDWVLAQQDGGAGEPMGDDDGVIEADAGAAVRADGDGVAVERVHRAVQAVHHGPPAVWWVRLGWAKQPSSKP